MTAAGTRISKGLAKAGIAALALLSNALYSQAPSDGAEAQPDAAELRLERLAANVRHATAGRAARRLQHALNHYREAGMWQEAAALFTRDATAQIGQENHAGRAAIAAFLQSQALTGTGRSALSDGVLNTHLAASPVVTVDPDGRTVRGRWREVSMLGALNVKAEWASGLYENEYAEEGGVWKISRMHYRPSFVGPYFPGWRNVDKSDTVTVFPFHFTPARAGMPIPLQPAVIAADRAPRGAAAQRRRVAELQQQLLCMQEQSRVESLQNAYGQYVDRRMWDDVADLFAADGSFEADQRGVYLGRASIRRALEQFGPADLAEGVVNDHTQMQPVITMAADCQSAQARGTEFVMTGQNGKDAWWGINIHENTYRRIDGKWQVQTMHVRQRLRSDYFQGWAHSAEPVPVAPAGFTPDAPPTVKYEAFPALQVPPVHFSNPGKGGAARKLPATAAARSMEDLLSAAELALDIVIAQDGSENVSNAYGYYIDEFLWDNTADVFSVNGSKELSYVGNYIGRESVRASLFGRYGSGGRRATSMTLHQKTAPVITVAPDGRSALIRTKLVQLNSARDADGSYVAGIYENATVREQGVWKISRMDLDYAWTANYTGGWARVAANTSQRFAPATAVKPPPDGPLRGVTYAPYPGLAPMAFHYNNPVSGRAPPELLPP